MANVLIPYGNSSIPGELTTLPNGRWKLITKTPLQQGDNIPAKVLSLGAAFSTIYTLDSDETPFASLRLVGQAIGSDTVNNASKIVVSQEWQTLTSTFVEEVDDIVDYDVNGLKRITRTLIAEPGTSTAAFVVGTQAYSSAPTTYLARVSIENGEEWVKVKAEYLEPGIVDAQVQQEDGGLLFVTFRSFYSKITPTCLNSPTYTLTDLPNLAFQGGATASLFRNRVENVLGYKVYSVTVMMKSDGSALAVGSDNTIHSYQAWVEYEKPGLLDVSTNDGPEALPGNTRWVKALIDEVLTTVSTVDNTYKPFSVTNWASYNVSYTPSDGSAPVNVAKGAHGYLANSSFAASNTTYAGIAVDVVAAAAYSDPTPSAFYALSNQVIGANAAPAFITDAGVKWYRKRRVSVVGTFGDYLS